MKPEVKKRIQRYGIPVDLVILATGLGLFFRNIPATALVIIYLLVVAVSTVRFGGRGGVPALVTGLAAMVFGFPSAVYLGGDFVFLSLSLVGIGASQARALKGRFPLPAHADVI